MAPHCLGRFRDLPGCDLTRFPFAKLVALVYPFARINDAFRKAYWQQGRQTTHLTRRVSNKRLSRAGNFAEVC
jgi:hypothetical protein